MGNKKRGKKRLERGKTATYVSRENREAGQVRDSSFWKRLEEYNSLDARARASVLADLGFRVSDGEVLGILTKSHFVIPGRTRFECRQCGECCRYAKKIASFIYEPCPFLDDNNLCSKHDSRYQVCRWFPFWLYNDPKIGLLLTIKPYCSGYGHGGPVEYGAVAEKLMNLSQSTTEEADGAFVIHEVLYLPEKKEWVFPSKQNIDKLMKIIAARDGGNTGMEERTANHLGELHYAHHYTSGLLGAISEPQCTVGRSGKITDVNGAFEALSQRKAEQLVGNEFHALFINPESVRKSMSFCFSRGKITSVPQRLSLPDGTGAPLLLNGLLYRDRADGMVHAALVCAAPVSSTVYNEVTQSHNYARGLLEAGLDALAVIDLDGVITDVNEATVVMTGITREALVGSRFIDYFDDQSSARKGLEMTFTGGQVRNYELNLIDAEKRSIPVSFNATVYRDSDGVASGIFAAARDIREIRMVMREMERAKNYARGLIESCLDLMVTVSGGGRITDVNEAAANITGRKRDELIGSDFRDYFDDPARAQNGVEQTFALGKLRNYQLNLMNRSGGTIPVSFNATVYRDSGGEIQGIFAVARDISERLKMIGELEAAKNYARGLIESCRDLMVTVNSEGVITDVNEAAVQITGRSRESLISSRFREYFVDPLKAQIGVDLTYKEGHVKNYELDLKTSSGTVVPVSFGAGLYRDSGGMVQGVFAVARVRE